VAPADRYGSGVSIGVREATYEDAAALGEFLAAQGLPTEDILAPSTVYWLAETASRELIASAGLELGSEAGLLRSVAVAEVHRGKGLGKRMVTSALDKARAHRLRHVYLFSTGAGSYFVGLGFVESTVEELVAALPNGPQVIRFAALGWLSTEVAWRIDL
jgi:N-acetylglutamate synthase-like GNAT family acetyltransferase